MRVIHHPENVGLNAVALAVRLARGYYIVELDDDVVRFPDDWLAKMLHAFKKVPQIGYMAANVVQDEFTTGEKDIPEAYTVVDYDGVVLEHGPTWGWCSMTSLEVLSRVGNFPRRRGRLNFTEDEDYVRRCSEGGLYAGHPAGGRGLSCLWGGHERPVRLSRELPQEVRGDLRGHQEAAGGQRVRPEGPDADDCEGGVTCRSAWPICA